MSVNNLTIEQAYTMINALQAEVVGNDAQVQAVDYATFTSVANTTLAAGYDAVLGAIMQMVRKTIIAVRPYSAKLRGIEMTADKWAAITRKINFVDSVAEEDPTFNRTGDVVGYNEDTDMYNAEEAKVLETHFYGDNIYMKGYKVYEEQLVQAFTGPEAFASFMAGLTQHYSNLFEQWFEDVKRAALNNFILGKVDAGNVVYLLDEYNAATGATLTPTTYKQAANLGPFMKWAFARIAQIRRVFENRSLLYQSQIDGKPITRHTPRADQRLIMDAAFLGSMDAEVLADTYHDDFLNYETTETVDFWQNIKDPDKISGQFATIDNNGAIVNKTGEVENVIGVLFDRDAVGVNIGQNELRSTPINPKTQFSVIWHHVRTRMENDQTEKGVVFALTAGE